MEKRVLKDSHLYAPILIMFFVLALRVYYVFANLFSGFANISDVKLHATWLFFLAKYGFYDLVPNWWNGFAPFTTYPPGFSFFSLPWHYLIGDPFRAIFFSVLQTLILGLIFVLLLGKIQKMSRIKSIAIFLFFFANPQITDYMKIGRYPELLGWVFFIFFFTIIFWYKDNKIDKKFLLIIPAYSSVILTHLYPTIIASLLVLCLFLVKKNKERFIVALSFLLTMILTSFWWVPFLRLIMSRSYKYAASYELLNLGSFVSYNTIFLISFLLVFFFYYKNSKQKRNDLLFFSSLIILNLLVLTRLVVFIPVLNDIFINPYNLLFLLLTILLFFRIDIDNYPIIIKKNIPLILIFISISYLAILLVHTPNFTPRTTDARLETLFLLPYVEGRYMMIPESTSRVNPEDKYDGLVLSFATVFYNLSTPFGSSYHPNTIPDRLMDSYQKIYGCPRLSVCDESKLEKLSCEGISEVANKQNVKSLLSANEGCELLERCGFREKIKKSKACLFFV